MSNFLDQFRPDLRVRAITDIDPVSLYEQGYVGLLLDLDNTLLPWKSSDLPESSKRWIERAKQAGMKPCIVSNTHYPKRLDRIASGMEVPWVAQALKPRGFGFEKAAKMIGCGLENAVVVGDQLLTDILGGNLACAYTILVNPMHPREFIGTKISRVFERIIFWSMGTASRQGTKSEPGKSEEKDTK